MYTNAHRAIRALRLQRGLDQATLGSKASASRQIVSRIERGQLSGMTLGSLDRVAAALGASVSVQVRWRGEELDRLIDAAHAALQQAVAAHMSRTGWDVRAEVSFNHYGDRGRVDLLALHTRHRLLVVAEIKSGLGDLQDTLGRLDVKARLGRQIAADVGWEAIRGIVPALVIGASSRSRRAVADHGALFARYSLRGRAALAWLRRPVDPVPGGLLWFADVPNSRGAVIARQRRARRGSYAHRT